MHTAKGDLPVPFLFNMLKHHHGYQCDFIEQAKIANYSPSQISRFLIIVGRLMIDLYYGKLSPNKIASEVEAYLSSIYSYEEEEYYKFINTANKNFRKVELSDGSSWTLLIGRDAGRYVHIHPSRGSANTIRVGAIALKTAICLKIDYGKELQYGNLVKLTNEVREKYLDESPIKNEVYTKGIRRVLELF